MGACGFDEGGTIRGEGGFSPVFQLFLSQL